MCRDKTINKWLLRQKPDEIFSHSVRINDKMTSARKFYLFYPNWQTRTCDSIYFINGKPVTTGRISKSEVAVAMRKLSVEFR